MDKLVGPRIMQSGIGQAGVGIGTSGTIVPNAATIKFAKSLDGVLTDYAVLVTPLTSAASPTACVTSQTVDVNSQFNGFTVNISAATSASAASSQFFWAIVKNTGATVTIPSNLWALT